MKFHELNLTKKQEENFEKALGAKLVTLELFFEKWGEKRKPLFMSRDKILKIGVSSSLSKKNKDHELMSKIPMVFLLVLVEDCINRVKFLKKGESLNMKKEAAKFPAKLTIKDNEIETCTASFMNGIEIPNNVDDTPKEIRAAFFKYNGKHFVRFIG